MLPILNKTKQKQDVVAYSGTISLADGSTTMVHVVRYDLKQFCPRVVSFERATYLIEWCQAHGVKEAMNGGFFHRRLGKALGELWTGGRPMPYEPFTKPWAAVRGTLQVDSNDQPTLNSRVNVSKIPTGDLLQAGPMLVFNGVSQIVNDKESEGISLAAHQLDDDITVGRFPRAAIALSESSIWSIVCDGSSAARTGLSLSELADLAISLGADSALNLDGGGSATQISGGKLRNHPFGEGQFYSNGRPIHSAIIFARR